MVSLVNSLTKILVEIPPPASSLYLQVFITFEMYYSCFYVFFLFAIEFYKGYGGLLFPPNVWGLEMTCIIVFFLIQLLRLDLGRRANRNEHATATKFFMIFSFLACIFYAYFALYTTYVLTVDIGFGLIGFFFAFFEIFISLYAYIQFNKLEVL